MAKRRRGEFSEGTKQQIIQRGYCEECGEGYNPEDPWHCHHLIFLGSVIARAFSEDILACSSNGMLLHNSCHKRFHRREKNPPIHHVRRVITHTGISVSMFDVYAIR
jgi:hypothetical protein